MSTYCTITRNIAPCFTQRLICQQNEKANDYADIIEIAVIITDIARSAHGKQEIAVIYCRGYCVHRA